MASISLKSLVAKRDGIASALKQMDEEIRSASAALKQMELNRVATDGGLQVANALIREAEQAAATTKGRK